MHKTWNPLVAVLAVSLGLTTACHDTDDTMPARRMTSSPTAPQALTIAAVDSGRALAANCFQCHGTDGNASELKIAGESASEIIDELNEMRAEHPGSNIMNVHALAYTPAEITLIANYFSQQGH